MIRKATIEDVQALRRLAHASEAHWGYSGAFMETFDREFNITADFIRQNPVFAGFDENCGSAGALVAFWGLQPGDDGWELEYFYVAEALLGKGYGRRLWQHMTEWCREQGIDRIHFVTSPQAVPFYEKMGVVQAGETASAIDGRMIPYLEYKPIA